MNFILTVCNGSKSRKIKNPSPEDIEQALDTLIPVLYYFVILEAKEPVQNCVFVQTLITRGSAPEIKYVIETRFEYENEFKQYKTYTNDVNYLKKMFRMFALQENPDITGWTDITAELIEESKKEPTGEKSA